MHISLVVPGRNNLELFKWSYNSIRRNQGSHTVDICFADDASTDGTWDWVTAQQQFDPHLKAIRNIGPDRVGHTILYDQIVDELVATKWFVIWHCDMYLMPGALDALETHLQSTKSIVSLTRIEPALHPPGPEKITISDAPIEPDECTDEYLDEIHSNIMAWAVEQPLTTSGVFAPWACTKEFFNEVGGHDKLFAPQSKEDSDIWNRMLLKGATFTQTWRGFVFHLTCRGSRFNPKLTTPGTNSKEWEAQNWISTKNFVRKWKSMPLHDEYIHPIINTPTLLTHLIVSFVPTKQQWEYIEPMGDTIECKNDGIRQSYLDHVAGEKTLIDLHGKLVTQPPENSLIIPINRFDYHLYNINWSDFESNFNAPK